MEIERINEYTVKFFVPFQDVEIRGFSKEEVLFQPERGEELFWEIMEEINQMEEIQLESPLWIQVHVTDLGLEVMAMGIQALAHNEFGGILSGYLNGTFFEQLEKILEHIQMNDKEQPETFVDLKENHHQAQVDGVNEIEVFSFLSFDDVIQLSEYEQSLPKIDGIYVFEGKYYLGVFSHTLEKEQWKNRKSLLLEFAEVSHVGWARIQTYGNCVGKSDGLKRIRQAFFS